MDLSQFGIVDPLALQKALNTKRVGYIASDVYSESHLDQFNFRHLDSVLWHTQRSDLTQEGFERASLEAIAMLKEYFNV